jgi:hypothetical protein
MLALGFVPIFVILLLFGFYLDTSLTPNNQSTTTAINSRSSPSAVDVTNSSLGLNLTLSADSTIIPKYDTIDISTSVANMLPQMNNLTATSNWAIQNLRAGPCDYTEHNDSSLLFSPVGIAVFRGNYGINNISAASALPIWAEITCPAQFGYNEKTGLDGRLVNISSYALLPSSDSAYYTAYYSPMDFGSPIMKGEFTTQMSTEAQIYAGDNTTDHDSLLSSAPSNYTVVAGDEWGQLVLLHFLVTPSNNFPKYGIFLSSSGLCTESNYSVPCFADEFAYAFVFNCASAAATASGCTTQVTDYNITVWYPFVNATADTNCKYVVKGYTGSSDGHCLSISNESFVLSPSWT